MRPSVSDALIETEIAELARRTARVFPDESAWGVFVGRWLATGDREEELVAEFHRFNQRLDALVRPAPNVEGYVLGSTRVLCMRWATQLMAFFQTDEETRANLRGEALELCRELRSRLDEVEAARSRTPPKLYGGPLA